MPDTTFSHIACIIDRSGSMQSIASDAIGGFNAFLESQKKVPGKAVITVVLFNDEYLKLYDAVPLERAEPLTDTTYNPAGLTALLDAVGKTMDELGQSLAATPEAERPGKVIIAILTDGEENSSREYSRQQIFEKITHQSSAYSWEFVFLAANQDAIQAGRELGIAAADTTNFDATADGVQYAMAAMSEQITDKRNNYY